MLYAGNEMAKYGTPEWPWLKFGRFLKGDDFPRTGVISLVEKDAKFSNAFGAMVHVTVFYLSIEGPD
jgi:hypothetical protein